MKKVYYYFFFEPIKNQYVDKPEIKPECTFTVNSVAKAYEIALFSNDNDIYMLRIMVPGLNGELISNEDEVVQNLKEHMLSILRMTYDHELSIFPKSIWVFYDEDEYPDWGVNMELVVNKPLDYDRIKGTFLQSLNIRKQMKLLSDCQNRWIPMQYRFLSLYKFLELEFKEKGKFTNEFGEFLNQYEKEFKDLNLSNRLLKNYIHELRDKCAHIKSNKEIVGVIELDGKSQESVQNFLSFMIPICANLMNEKYGHENFEIGSRPPLKPDDIK